MTSDRRTSRPAGGIGVLETRPFFAPELQRQFQGEETPVRSLRLVSDLAAMAGPRVLVLALECDEDAVVHFVRDVCREPDTACLLVRGTQLTDTEWLLREIGARCVIDPFIRGDELAAICRKLLNSMNRVQTRERHV